MFALFAEETVETIDCTLKMLGGGKVSPPENIGMVPFASMNSPGLECCTVSVSGAGVSDESLECTDASSK